MHFQQGTFNTTTENQGAVIQKAWELNCHVHAAADGSNVRVVANPDNFKAFQQFMRGNPNPAVNAETGVVEVAAEGVPNMEATASAPPAVDPAPPAVDPAPNPPQS